jgi:molybdopterin-guanine dinucleotide biosynthesis protein A
VARALADGRRRANAFFPDVSVRYVEEALLVERGLLGSFTNINLPADLEAAERLVRLRCGAPA